MKRRSLLQAIGAVFVAPFIPVVKADEFSQIVKRQTDSCWRIHAKYASGNATVTTCTMLRPGMEIIGQPGEEITGYSATPIQKESE